MNPGFHVFSRKDGGRLREATASEVAAFFAGQRHPHYKPGSFAFAKPVVLDADTFVNDVHEPSQVGVHVPERFRK